MLAIAACVALLLIGLQSIRGTDEAAAQASKNERDDIGALVASGNEVEGRVKSQGKPRSSAAPDAMPQTGDELDTALLVGLVLLLDGALALLLTSKRSLQTDLPN